jgi:predicted RNA-binding protein (virulence factor B family)
MKAGLNCRIKDKGEPVTPELCRMHNLTVDHVDAKGVWLIAGDRLAHLPLKEAPRAAAGDILEVFLYQDVSGRLQATCRRPLVQAGEFALLTVRSVDQHGAFLDWGLAKELLAPFSLQPERMQVGRSYLVKVSLDQQGRPFANACIEDCFDRVRPDLADGDAVSLLFWKYTELGAKVIVNSRFPGLLYREELPPGLAPGMQLAGYVKRLREDGKLDVTLRRVGVEGVADAKEAIMKALAASGGTLPLGDQSSPSLILQTLGISKKSFKKAVGGLYKDGLLILGDGDIKLKKS